MTLRRLCVLLLCLSAAVLAYAQTADLPWWTSPVVHDLGLTPQQTERIKQIVRSYRDRLFDAHNDANKAEAELKDILNEPKVNPATAKSAIDRLAQARAENTRLITEMSVHIRSVLTFDQWRELVKRWEEVQKGKRGQATDVAP